MLKSDLKALINIRTTLITVNILVIVKIFTNWFES